MGCGRVYACMRSRWGSSAHGGVGVMVRVNGDSSKQALLRRRGARRASRQDMTKRARALWAPLRYRDHDDVQLQAVDVLEIFRGGIVTLGQRMKKARVLSLVQAVDMDYCVFGCLRCNGRACARGRRVARWIAWEFISLSLHIGVRVWAVARVTWTAW